MFHSFCIPKNISDSNNKHGTCLWLKIDILKTKVGILAVSSFRRRDGNDEKSCFLKITRLLGASDR